jgi:hypothetical protein
MHPIGQETIFPIQKTEWIGDLPSGDPTDWFASSDEYYEVVGYNPDDDEEDERLIDEY